MRVKAWTVAMKMTVRVQDSERRKTDPSRIERAQNTGEGIFSMPAGHRSEKKVQVSFVSLSHQHSVDLHIHVSTASSPSSTESPSTTSPATAMATPHSLAPLSIAALYGQIPLPGCMVRQEERDVGSHSSFASERKTERTATSDTHQQTSTVCSTVSFDTSSWRPESIPVPRLPSWRW